MSQWQRIQMLDKVHMDQIDCLYSDDTLPMEVRQYLAYWIEEQNWSQAVELDSSQACCLFHTMLASLDDQIGRLALGEENNANMLLKHNLRRSKLHLWSKYQECPQELAIAIEALLKQERAILSEAFSASQASVDSPCDSPVPSTHQHKIEERLMEMHRRVQSLKCSIEQHDDLQDNFDFSFRTHEYLEKTTPASEPIRTQTIQNLQTMLNKLNFFRQEVSQWQIRQRLVCIGEKYDTSLGHLEEWFTKNAEILFQLLHLLMMLKEMYEKVTYQTDPLKDQLPLLVKRLQEQIICLLKSAFVVEVQPKMQVPNKRPLVLRTSHKDATDLPGFRRFNILTSSTKTLMMHEPQKQGLICDFKYITLKEQKISGTGKGNKGISEGSLPVTEELHIITFTLDYCYRGIECQLQTSTLPVVIVSNANQISSAWASILWFIMLSRDTKNQLFFSKPPAATWAQLSTVLSWQFSAATEEGLDKHQLKMLGEKLCGSGVNSQSTITWDQFSKEATTSSPEENSFSFWTWIDGILLLIQEHLLQLWRKRKELEFLSLPDIIRDYQLFASEVIPENPLLYLYPDTPRDEALGPYYKERREVNTTEQKKYLNRRLIRVSTQPGETQVPDVKELLPISSELVADELQNPENTMKNFLLDKEEQQELPSPFDIPELRVDDPEFQTLLSLENICNDTTGNDIDDLMTLYSKL
ncbi:putative Signal transducer and activator of transcription protein [Naja naja]|nr:putative Signal transducer and activator of transcription protein [Naja naja]